jgi:hypothetical protein
MTLIFLLILYRSIVEVAEPKRQQTNRTISKFTGESARNPCPLLAAYNKKNYKNFSRMQLQFIKDFFT